MTMKTVAVDLDGVLATYDGWKGIKNIGAPIPGAKEFVDILRKRGFKVVVFTTRTNPVMNKGQSLGKLVKYVTDWLHENKIKANVSITKPAAEYYIDDRALLCQPQVNKKAYTNALEIIGDDSTGN